MMVPNLLLLAHSPFHYIYSLVYWVCARSITSVEVRGQFPDSPRVGWRDQWQVPLPSEPSQQFSLILNDTFTYYYLCFYYLTLIFLFFNDFKNDHTKY